MFLLKWYERFLHIRLEAEGLRNNLARERVCESCEYLKLQLDKEQQLNRELITKLTDKPIESPTINEQPLPAAPRFMPWHVRRQMLEAEDRRAASVARQREEEIKAAGLKVSVGSHGVKTLDAQPAPADDPDVIALEQEMAIVEKEREKSIV